MHGTVEGPSYPGMLYVIRRVLEVRASDVWIFSTKYDTQNRSPSLNRLWMPGGYIASDPLRCRGENAWFE